MRGERMSTLQIEARLGRVVLIMACMSCVTSMSVRAQSLPELEIEQEGLAGKPKDHWSAALGAGVASVPRYQGADTSRARVVPLALIRYDDIFLGPFGLGWAAIHWGGLRAGPVLGYEGGRRESADPHLYGLGNTSASI